MQSKKLKILWSLCLLLSAGAVMNAGTATVRSVAPAFDVTITADSEEGTSYTKIFDADANINHGRGNSFITPEIAENEQFEVTALTIRKRTNQTFAGDILKLWIYEGTADQWGGGDGDGDGDMLNGTGITNILLDGESFVLNGEIQNNDYITMTLDSSINLQGNTSYIFFCKYEQVGGPDYLHIVQGAAALANPGSNQLQVRSDKHTKVGSPNPLTYYVQGRVVLKYKANPVFPKSATDDIPKNSHLRWTAGSAAIEHDVYFGTNLDVVRSATPTSDAFKKTLPLGETSYDPGTLDYGVTYYWRIDEVNDLNPDSPWKGDVWSFEVEPKTIALDAASISIIPSSVGYDPQGNLLDVNNVINGAGLDSDGLHDTDIIHMWKAAPSELDSNPSIEFMFDKPYKLADMQIWNHNSANESVNDGYSIKDVNVYYLDGTEWVVLSEITQLAQAPGTVGYAGELFPLNIVASGIRIEAVSPYATITIPGVGTFPKQQYGLSEVAFHIIPNTVRAMGPTDGAVNVDPTSVELIWRAGREAMSHNVYLSTDVNDVLDRTAPMTPRTEPTLVPELEMSQTYYWCVDEVNDLADPSVWPGPVQSFTTSNYIVVDDFDDYTDDWGHMVFQSWSDGLGWEDPEGNTGPANGSGSGLGHWPPPTMETTIARSGQSMPFAYGLESQTDSYATLDQSDDWSKHGIKSLSLWFYGQADNTGGQLYVKVNGTKYDYPGPATDIQTAQWFPFTLNLDGVTGVDSLTIGVVGGSGIIYIDDIRLYPLAAETYSPIVPSSSDPNWVAYYEFEGNVNDSRGNYPGTATGDPGYVDGKVGQALVVDGTDDQIVNKFEQEVVWPAYSVSLWVKTDIFGQANYTSFFNNNSSGSDFQLDVNGSDSYRYMGVGGNGLFGPVTTDWVHLTASCDGSQVRLYYNGRPVGTVNTANTVFGQIAVGINRGMNMRFSGNIDDVRVFDRAVSQAEAAGLAGLTDELVLPFE